MDCEPSLSCRAVGGVARLVAFMVPHRTRQRVHHPCFNQRNILKPDSRRLRAIRFLYYIRIPFVYALGNVLAAPQHQLFLE